MILTFLIVSLFVLLIPLLSLICPSKGKVGEKRVAKILSRLSNEEYHIFNDVVISYGKGTSQIDHIVVSQYGIFVIETKFYEGWIFGSEESEYWTQIIYRNKARFYNPILQNKGHVKALKALLKESGDLFICPIVTFSDRASLNIKTDESCVTYWKELPKIISGFTEVLITPEQVNEICLKIESSKYDVKDKDILRKHNEWVKSTQKKKEEKINQGVCPRCGGQLILRKGKYGDFIGCSNYPKCRYTYNT